MSSTYLWSPLGYNVVYYDILLTLWIHVLRHLPLSQSKFMEVLKRKICIPCSMIVITIVVDSTICCDAHWKNLLVCNWYCMYYKYFVQLSTCIMLTISHTIKQTGSAASPRGTLRKKGKQLFLQVSTVHMYCILIVFACSTQLILTITTTLCISLEGPHTILVYYIACTAGN